MRAGYRRGPLRSGVVRPEEQRLDLACEATAVPRRKRGALNIEGGGAGGAIEWVCACAHLRRCLQDGTPLAILVVGRMCCERPD